MYRWQTLTLARIEHLNRITPAQHAAARDLLFAIGSQHFPEPTTTFPPSPSDAAWMCLQWSVDDRVWYVNINRKGECRSRFDGAKVSGVDVLLTTDREHVAACVHWLLFGQSPPVSAGESSPADPLPGADTIRDPQLSADAVVINQKAFMRP